MKCPVCVTESLVMSDRQGIEIDYCAKCRGVWLDRGELDKIIERSMDGIDTSSRGNAPRATSHHHPHGSHHDDMFDSDYGKHKYKRRKNWLFELFD